MSHGARDAKAEASPGGACLAGSRLALSRVFTLPGRAGGGRLRGLLVLSLLAALSSLPVDLARSQDFVRPVDTAPSPENIGGDYELPAVQRPLARPHWQHVLDVVLLGGALGLVAWIVLGRRSRAMLVAVTIGSLLYFGFWREGCVCPIGATQNVVVALVDPGYSIPFLVVLIFFLPLFAALLFGRVFCGGVCPLGAIQDLFVLRPVQIPRRLDRALGLLKYAYLGVAIGYAVLPAAEREFLICRFDPFVGLFRRTGPGWMLLLGGGLLVLGMFVGRVYCRYLCPYGALLAIVSRIAWKRVSITPSRELDCGLCAHACPFGAIEKNRAVRSSCLACARCYDSCPLQRVERGRRPVAPAAREPVPGVTA